MLSKKPKILLTGVSFDTNNMGLSALGEGAIKCILQRWPDAEVHILAYKSELDNYELSFEGRKVHVKILPPIMFCRNIFLPNHFLVLLLHSVLLKLVPATKLRSVLVRYNSYLKELDQVDFVADITGGDSFSDLYGIRRFILDFLRKWLRLFYGKKLIMLPQTYGPFKRKTTKLLAKYILKRSSMIYSRDRYGLETVKQLIKEQFTDCKLRISPDVAFALDYSHPKKDLLVDILGRLPEKSLLVGLNISGLLYNGGYNRMNMFGLLSDYPMLINELSRVLLKDSQVRLLLVPHVFAPVGNVESDLEACGKVNDKLKLDFPGRILVAKGPYDQNEIKYLIGQCEFFIGSRMHSCIAALSQCVPAVGLAYSDKFKGVFETVGAEYFVIDLRQTSQDEVLKALKDRFAERNKIKSQLEGTMPQIKSKVRSLFSDIDV